MKKLLFLLLSFTLGLFVSACSSSNTDEDDNTPDPVLGTITPATGSKVLSYDKFLTANDVTIEDPDTTNISVSADYLKSINTTLNSGDVVTIWRSLNEQPFIRKITGVTSKATSRGTERALITTAHGDISDAISDANVEMSSELFYNSAGATTSAQYTDGTTAHPAAIIYLPTSEDGSIADGGEGVEVKNLIKEMDRQSPQTRGTWHIIDENFLTEVALGPDKTFSVGITGGNTHVYSEFTVNMKIKWFKLKKFEAIFKGGVQMRLPLTITATKPLLKFERELTIYRFVPRCFVYWVGTIPVSVTVEPSIVADLTAGVDAQLSLSIPVNFGADFSVGPKYDGNWSNENSFSTNHSVESKNIALTAALSAHAGIGLMFKEGVYLYGAAGPYVMFGPAAEFSVTGAVSATNGGKKTATISLTGSLIARAKLGAELKVAKWRLAHWEKNWDIAQWSLWTKDIWTQDISDKLPSSLPRIPKD